MKSYEIEQRPSALLAARAPHSGLPVALADVVVAHVDRVGSAAVPSAMAFQVQIQTQARWIQVQGTTGFVVTAANDNRTAPKLVGGARGVPPRGRPV